MLFSRIFEIGLVEYGANRSGHLMQFLQRASGFIHEAVLGQHDLFADLLLDAAHTPSSGLSCGEEVGRKTISSRPSRTSIFSVTTLAR